MADFQNAALLPENSLADDVDDFGVTTIKNGMLRDGQVKPLSYYAERSEGWYDPPRWEVLAQEEEALPKVDPTPCPEEAERESIKTAFAGSPTDHFELIRCFKLDLDGNGTDEILFAARNWRGPPEPAGLVVHIDDRRRLCVSILSA